MKKIFIAIIVMISVSSYAAEFTNPTIEVDSGWVWKNTSYVGIDSALLTNNSQNATLFCVVKGYSEAKVIETNQVVISGPNGSACIANDSSIIIEKLNVGKLPDIARVKNYNARVLDVISLIECE